MIARTATLGDVAAIAEIYNQGILDRMATFETRLREPREIHAWFDGLHPVVVVEDQPGVVAFAATFAYRPRECYAGIAEFSVYVSEAFRRRGAGRVALDALIQQARQAGFWKLLSRIFVENVASRNLVCAAGFREVGIYKKHGKLDGQWRDVVIVERFLL